MFVINMKKNILFKIKNIKSLLKKYKIFIKKK